MAVDKFGKQYCICNLTSMIIEELHSDNINISCDALLYRFTQSKTYKLLCDTKTGLWTQGPDYILALYKLEMQKNK